MTSSIKLIILVTVITVTFSPMLTATPQREDKLIYENSKVDLVVCGGAPSMEREFFLERYFAKGFTKPKALLNEGSTACYRGYIATWLLENDALYLKKLDTAPWPDEPGKDIPIVNGVRP